MKALPRDSRANNFSILRMSFAAMVILSHSCELLDGNRSREILSRIFGTISLGELAVDGFFIVSGYLITKSYLASAHRSYLLKRILRIYPGFLVAFFVSVLLCRYFSRPGMSIPGTELLQNILNAICLLQPNITAAYPHSFYPSANGAMWSISYEFHCYLLIMLLGFFGVFQKRRLLLGITALLIGAYLIFPEKYAPFMPGTAASVQVSHGFGMQLLRLVKSITVESPIKDIRLFGIFLAGSCFYIFRDAVPYRSGFAAAAAVLLAGCLFSKHLAEPGLAVFGGYLIFWFALHVRVFSASRFFDKTDLSYGIYLYAWPIQKALISQLPRITPAELSLLTLTLCGIVAYFSWTLIEKPFLNLKSHDLPGTAKLTPAAKNI